MSGTGKVVRSGVGRRKVQTLVIVLVVAMATASAVLGGTLVVASQAPFDRAFKQQHGAHLIAQFDAGKVTESEVEATAEDDAVSQAEGPFRTVPVDALLDRGMRLPSLTVAGREKPGGAVDKVTVTEGRWAEKPGEIVLFDNSGAGGEMAATQVGGEIEVPDLPGKPTLKIVGLARSVSESADAWVVPEQIEELTPSGQDGGYQMLYRFDSAATKAQVDDGRDAVMADVSDKAVTGTKSWLSTKDRATGQARLLVPFLIVFGVLGVFMAVLIVGNIVTGAVSSATRRIGILKALGFTPAQVVRSYMAQALIPAAIGAGIGVVAGNLLTQPVLGQTNRLYGTSDSGVVWWIDVLGFGGGLAIVGTERV